jgi:alpha-1,2-mannosyltransferase
MYFKLKNISLGILLTALLFYIIRACTRQGDFIGYINAGHLTLNGQDIYSDYLNTWPPFFSVFCVPLSILNDINGIVLRAIWLLATVAAMFWLMRISVRRIYRQELLLPFQSRDTGKMLFTNTSVLIPFILIFRYLLDNIANIQINIFLLLSTILIIDWFIKEKYLWAGVLLAFSISLKVFPIFLFLYFVFKREFKVVGWTILFLLFFNTIPILVYGYDNAIGYYIHWWNDIASPFASVQHKNQSFFSMLRSLLTNESPGLDIYLNVINLPVEMLKKVSYGILVLGAVFPMYLFRNKLSDKIGSFALLEYTFVLTAIPILSPLAWKAYFIFLWPAFLVIYFHLYHDVGAIKSGTIKMLRGLFILGILLTVLTTDLFLGSYLADLAEVFSTITIGTLILMVIILIIYSIKRKEIPA